MAGQFPFFTSYTKRYLAGIFLCWTLVAISLFYATKAEGFIGLRSAVGGWADYFFKYFTHMGDGITSIVLGLIFLYRKKFSLAFLLIAGFILSGIWVQVLKYFFAMPRPKTYFKELGITIEQVRDIELFQSLNSFPSGHTASAFAAATALVLANSWWEKKWLLALMLAILVGYSRVYLGQHFPADVLAGSVLGVFSTLILWFWLRYRKPAFSLMN